ncbi:MAG: hypothetical protein KAI47_16990 [Deltaproteobacteria bacterium]|nr:hypothetical protein [Deltaproteobacteria bacterium]
MQHTHTMKRLLTLLAIAALPLSACSDDTATHDIGSGAYDSMVSDQATNDTQADAAPSDTGKTTDASGQDQGSAPEQGAADLAGKDSIPNASTCASPASPEPTGAAKIVACVSTTAKVNQCQASTFCGAGWHLCTASEYQKEFKAAPLPTTVTANVWLAGCVRDGAGATAPADHVCSKCDGSKGSKVPIAESCTNGLVIETSNLYAGVRSGAACVHLGNINDGTTSAYWNMWPSNQTMAGALCCQ